MMALGHTVVADDFVATNQQQCRLARCVGSVFSSMRAFGCLVRALAEASLLHLRLRGNWEWSEEDHSLDSLDPCLDRGQLPRLLPCLWRPIAGHGERWCCFSLRQLKTYEHGQRRFWDGKASRWQQHHRSWDINMKHSRIMSVRSISSFWAVLGLMACCFLPAVAACVGWTVLVDVSEESAVVTFCC